MTSLIKLKPPADKPKHEYFGDYIYYETVDILNARILATWEVGLKLGEDTVLPFIQFDITKTSKYFALLNLKFRIRRTLDLYNSGVRHEERSHAN